jgi:hypothetical protein
MAEARPLRLLSDMSNPTPDKEYAFEVSYLGGGLLEYPSTRVLRRYWGTR